MGESSLSLRLKEIRLIRFWSSSLFLCHSLRDDIRSRGERLRPTVILRAALSVS